ncbi:MAG: hypothetical protein ACXV9P_16190, partial [Acidimicrobiia bacterium]
PIPTGTHTITLNATPRGWHLGIAITITATLLLTLLLTWTLLRRVNQNRHNRSLVSGTNGA